MWEVDRGWGGRRRRVAESWVVGLTRNVFLADFQYDIVRRFKWWLRGKMSHLRVGNVFQRSKRTRHVVSGGPTKSERSRSLKWRREWDDRTRVRWRRGRSESENGKMDETKWDPINALRRGVRTIRIDTPEGVWWIVFYPLGLKVESNGGVE